MIPIKVTSGEPIPLTLQTYDGSEDVKVTAILSDAFGSEFARVTLDHQIHGLYSAKGPPMPPTGKVFAQYVTDKLERYAMDVDLFMPVPKVEKPEKILVGEVIAVEKLNEIIIGEVVSDEASSDPE